MEHWWMTTDVTRNFLFVWLGLWSIGAKVAHINYNLTGEPLLHSVWTATSRLLLVDEEVKDNITAEVQEQLSSPSFREEGGSVQISFLPDSLDQELASIHPVREPDSARDGQQNNSMCMLIYTSGTTGK